MARVSHHQSAPSSECRVSSLSCKQSAPSPEFSITRLPLPESVPSSPVCHYQSVSPPSRVTSRVPSPNCPISTVSNPARLTPDARLSLTVPRRPDSAASVVNRARLHEAPTTVPGLPYTSQPLPCVSAASAQQQQSAIPLALPYSPATAAHHKLPPADLNGRACLCVYIAWPRQKKLVVEKSIEWNGSKYIADLAAVC
ncbi:hypothetical protein BaRGS_00011449, partial [Batillaria attramentaria]